MEANEMCRAWSGGRTGRSQVARFPSSLLLPVVVLAGVIGLAPAQSHAQGGQARGLGSWMNPDIGLVYDLKCDLHDAERGDAGEKLWTTRGFRISTAELSIGADVDPYARIDFNAMFSETGAEIHELFFLFPALPLNLKLKGGHFLANFGRWSQFHSHAMPFSSEPRILHEYMEGHLSPTGLEISWLAPISHYLEFTGGVYNALVGHSHDTDPISSTAAWGPDNPPPGCHFHGDDIHCPGSPDLEEAYREAVEDPDAPTRQKTNRGLKDLAFLGRASTSVELGLSWSVDLGASIVHQPRYAHSQRFAGESYAKTVYGADVTAFWNPPERNLYTGLDFGIELLANDEQFEVKEDDIYMRKTLARSGFFAYGRYRLNKRWSGGVFGESFQPRQGSGKRRERLGAFLACNISHFQSIRLEFSHYDKQTGLDPVNMFIVQYDGVIGYHTHGRQR
jgi:hypothetical protein